ncbi:hemolysin family protein [Exiguobacterium acetylicum]|uniref:hemolysin family protein n=1 Tax=Exiguobacterium acetylicum TaxID=41170 RepID=UPI0039775F87
MDIVLTLNLLLLVVLIGLTAFFVGSEFAVVKVRMSRLDQMVQEGKKGAVLAKKVAGDLDYYLSACQLGITITALGLGALGKPTVEKLLTPVFDELGVAVAVSTLLSYSIAFIFVTFLHVVVGELAPKTLAIQYAERMTLLLAPALYVFGKVMYPFIWIMNGSARVLLRMFGVKPAGHEQAHSEEELKIIMAQSFQSGEINQSELDLMQNVFAFDERVTRDIMVPRMNMLVISDEMDWESLLQTMSDNPYTRYPVSEGTDKDRISGYINVKEVLAHHAVQHERELASFIKPLPIVSELTPLQETLLKMKQTRSHIALVIDEYGGTSGLITMEDILEEIVGDIRDEFDEAEQAEIEQLPDGAYRLAGTVLLVEMEERFGLRFAEADAVDTVGGYIQSRTTDFEEGTIVTDEGFTLEIMRSAQYQIQDVKLTLTPR